ncbi:MAG: hypothetical protein V4450_07335 [Bacteroidota bacterium]
MPGERNYTIDELADMMVDAVLSESILNKQTLVPKVRALIKTMVDLKNTPRNYDAKESKSTAARRLRTIEQKDAEIKFWLKIVRELDGDNIEKHFKQQKAMLVAKGFLTV